MLFYPLEGTAATASQAIAFHHHRERRHVGHRLHRRLAIIPSNDLPAAIPFWVRLGFARTGGDDDCVIMTGWGCEVHLIQADGGEWAVPEEHNPFGVFIRTPEVDAIAARVDDLIIRPGGILRHREWGMYECGLNGPDGTLVRIGWPSRLIKAT